MLSIIIQPVANVSLDNTNELWLIDYVMRIEAIFVIISPLHNYTDNNLGTPARHWSRITLIIAALLIVSKRAAIPKHVG